MIRSISHSKFVQPQRRRGWRRTMILWIAVSLSALAAARAYARPRSGTPPIAYRTADIDGVHVFYREAGRRGAPTILLLHGFPSLSRMWERLMPQLADRYHVIAPDYPGFGHSDAPDPAQFDYTFEHLAQVMHALTDRLGVTKYVLAMQDYGGPVGFRMALAHPERIRAMVVQNAVADEAGLGPPWDLRRAFWRDRAAHEAAVRAAMLSLDAARLRHVGHAPQPELYDPDTWTDEAAFLGRPGEADIQMALAYDYRTNVAAYPAWQAWLQRWRPPLLVVWGRYDTTFEVAGASAFRKVQPNVEIHIMDAGHFALDTQPAEVGALIRDFVDRLN
jgi:pimeloyl-ACP methyl ester carboxylesterase